MIDAMVGFVTDAADEHGSHPGKGSGQYDFPQRFRAVQIVRQPVHGMAAPEPDSIAHGALRVRVDDQRLETPTRESSSEIHRRGRFSDTPLLTNDRDDVPHALFELRG